MAQLSRPYQIILGVVVVFGLIWAVALRSHSSNPSEPSSLGPDGAEQRFRQRQLGRQRRGAYQGLPRSRARRGRS